MLADLTAEQRKALIEAVTEHYHGQGDAWDNILDPLDRIHAAVGFLAGWAASRGVKGEKR